MPFDSLTVAAVCDDVRERAVGGRIQKIIQPSRASVALSIYQHGRQHWLVLSADARFARVAVADDSLAKGFESAGPFVMLLRKYLDGKRLLDVAQVPHERIVVLSASSARLIVEIMGRHSNVVAVAEDDRILGAIKTVSPRLSSVRPIMPGVAYREPPARSRDPDLYAHGPLVDPYLEPEVFAELLHLAPPDTELQTALMGLLAGAGPFLIDQIVLRAGFAGSDLLRDVSIPMVLEAARSKYKLLQSREWEPVTFDDRRGRRDFAAFVPLGVDAVRRCTSMSAAVEAIAGGTESRDALAAVRRSVRERAERALRGAEARVVSLERGLGAAQEADEVMQLGQLLLAYQYLIEPSAEKLVIPELETVVPLDSALTASENAERYFRRYRKLRDARDRLPTLLSTARAEVERLRDLTGFIAFADSETDLRALERDVAPVAEANQKQESSRKRRGPLKFSLGDYIALVGRSARENDELTFRLAARGDLWLHARDRTGAHVLLRGPADVPVDTLEAAAQLAAYHSAGRAESHVEVVAAPVRDVRKVPGGPPGRVTYRNAQTYFVHPSQDGWRRA